MKWGVRRHQPYQKGDGPKGKFADKTKQNKVENASTNKTKVPIENVDGSQTIPKGFKFNRVGKGNMDVNQSGALYVSHGKEDAARYIKALGPTPLAKLLGTSNDVLQTMTVVGDIKVPSQKQTVSETAKVLSTNSKLLSEFNESFYSVSTTGDMSKTITKKDLDRIIDNPNSDEGVKLAYGVSSFLGDGNYAKESKQVYSHFKEKGYDAIPDLHDTLGGVSKTAMIVINTEKIKVESNTNITRDVMKDGKNQVKELEKLKMSDVLNR